MTWRIIEAIAIIAQLLMIAGQASGQEQAPLSWQIVGTPEVSVPEPPLPPSPEVTAPASLSFQLIGHPMPDAAPAYVAPVIPEVQKPKVFAYKPADFKCPGCDKLKMEADLLPVDLEWKSAPDWVKSYPTLHWQGIDGKWYQYQWGKLPTTEKDVWRFIHRYSETREKQPPKEEPEFHSTSYDNRRWTWPGEIKQHLMATHGYSADELAGLSHAQLVAIHNRSQNTPGLKFNPTASVSSYCPTCPR